MVSFTIPGNPVAQGRPRAARRGNRIMMYDPKPSKDYKEYVAEIAKEYAPEEPTEAALGVQMKIYREIPKSTTKKDRKLINEGLKRPVVRPDTDNYTKAILDALNGIIYKDDSQIVDLKASKYYSDDPRVEIKIEALF